MRTRILTGVVAAASAVMAFAASSASAATYTVHSCRLPDGTEIGLQRSVGAGAGWSYFGVANATAADASPCSSEGENIEVGGAIAYTSNSRWTFRAPEASSIGAFRVMRAVNHVANETTWALYANGEAGFPRSTPFESCVTAASCIPYLGGSASASAPEGASHLHLTEECSNPMFCSSANRTTISRAEIDLRDDHAPTASVRGLVPLTVQRAEAQAQTIAVDATDVGAGLLIAELLLDGQPVQVQRLSSAPTCQDAVPGDTRMDYITAQPCPTSASASFVISPSALSTAAHSVAVRVTDAAGNTRSSSAVTWSVSNAGQPSDDPRRSSDQNGRNNGTGRDSSKGTDGNSSGSGGGSSTPPGSRQTARSCKGTITRLYWRTPVRRAMRRQVKVLGKTVVARKGVRVAFAGRVRACPAGTMLRVTTINGFGHARRPSIRVRRGGVFVGYVSARAGNGLTRIYARNNLTLRLKRRALH